MRIPAEEMPGNGADDSEQQPQRQTDAVDDDVHELPVRLLQSSKSTAERGGKR
jgi:hypothetical protein